MKRILLFGTFSLFFANVISMLAGYGVNVFLARTLGPANYGIYAVVISLISLLSMILIGGMRGATSKFVSQNPAKAEEIKRCALKLNGFIGLFAFIAYFFSADLIAFVLRDPSLAPFIRFSALIIPAYFLYPVFLGYFNGLKQYHKQSLITILYSVAKFVAIVLFVYAGFSVFGAIFGFMLAPCVGLVAGLYFSRLKKIENRFHSMKILRFAIPLTIFAFSFESALTLGLLSVKSILIQNALTGYYNVALQISRLPYYFTMALGSALFPIVSYSFSNQKPIELKQHIKKALKYFLIFVLPGAIFISAFSREIVMFFFGQRFIASAQPLAILAPAAIFFCLFYILCIVLIGIEKQKLAMLIGLAILAIAWISNMLLVPIFSLNGAAIATLIAFFIGSIASVAAVWKFVPK